MTPTVDKQPGRAGQVPRKIVLEPSKGIPRYEDLISLRVLERSPTVALPMNTVKDQVTTTTGYARPTVDNPGPEHEAAIEEIEEFFDGNFNANSQEFDNLLKLWVNDILSPDAGVLEKVPTEPDADGTRWLAELYHLDGITMTKQLDQHGVIPEPPAPAFWQFAPRSALPFHSWDDVIRKLGHRDVVFQYGRRQHEPIPFSRDQIVWTETNPRPETGYGFGLVQQVKRWAEILLNVDVSNRRYFADNEIPQGILSIASGSQQELDRNRAYFQDTIKGETDHILPIFDAMPDEIGWFPIQGSPEELQFLDSQQWYHKLVWYLFGLNQNEIGDSGDVNQSIGQEHSRQVFRQTTRPLLDVLERAINVEILPAMEAYWRVDGEIEWVFETEHEQMQELERRRQAEDLSANLRTPNEIRRERGEEEVPWGDMPAEAVTAFVRANPGWVAEEWGGVEDAPSDGLGGMDMFSTRPTEDVVDVDGGAIEDLEAGSGNCQPGLGAETHQDDTGEIGEEFPAVADLVDGLQGEVGRQLEHAIEDLEAAIEDAWPEEVDEDRSPAVDLDDIVNELSVGDQLLEPVVEHNTAAMQASADQEADRLEEDLEEHYALVPEVAEIGIDFDLTNTFAWEAMRRRAAQNMVSVEQTVRDRVRNVLLQVAEEGVDGDKGVGAATQALRESVTEISDNHSRLVARTELPQASREGTQALGEATDVVGGKRWLASNDGRSRPWHDAMHDEVVGIDDSWTVPSGWQGEPHYQPNDYPRAAHTVGEDQPFNCRCVQQSVLEEDLPDDVQSLTELHGVDVEIHVTDRQLEVWREHARPGETMGDLLERIDANYSRNQGAPEKLGIGKEAYYRWIKTFDVY